MPRLFERLGIRGRRKRLVIAALILFPIVGIGSVELTSQSWFCDSCHIMNPYYDSWKHGAHKDIECVKCHISPGVNNFLAAKFNGLGQVVDDVLHRTSNKPSASVSQLACTRSGCHSVEKVRETAKTSGTFKFRHDKHLDLEVAGIKLACGTCHSHVKGDEHFEVNKQVCTTCHLIDRDPDTEEAARLRKSAAVIRMVVREGHTTVGADAEPKPADPAAPKTPPNACTACHEPPAGVLERNGLKVDHAQFLSYGAACESCHRNATLPPEPIADSRCLQCHTFGIEKATTPEEMHKVHLEGRHKIECFSCHGTIQHGLAAQSAAMELFDCKRCHKEQHGVQRGSYVLGAHGTEAAPAMSPMFLAHVECAACHTRARPISTKPESGATVAAATAEACDACHKKGLGEKMIPLWQKSTHELYDQISAQVAELKARPGADQSAVQAAERALTTIRMDGSWGVHNARYTEQLLQEAREKLGTALQRKEGGP